MIAAAGVAGVALVVMQLGKNQNVVTARAEFRSSILGVTNEITAVLADPSKCIATLGGRNALSTTSGIDFINGDQYQSTDSGGTALPGDLIKIKNYHIAAAPSDLASNVSYLIVNYQNKEILKGPELVSRKIKLYVEVDASNRIIHCRSLSMSYPDIWSRGTGMDIFYSGGNVGVGTSSPSARLDVNGGIKIGTTNAVCDSSLQGSVRYNGATTRLEYCNGIAWSQLGAPLSSCTMCIHCMFYEQYGAPSWVDGGERCVNVNNGYSPWSQAITPGDESGAGGRCRIRLDCP